MKKQTKMGLVILAFAAILGGCKKSDTLKSDSEILSKGNSKLVAGDGKWDLLGHGYDVTGELFERKNASKVSIIDIDRFFKDYPNRIPTPTDTKGGYNAYYGATAYDYMNDLNKKQTFGVSGTAGDSKGDKLYAGANFSLTNENQNIYTYNSKYSYSTYESLWRIKSIDFTDDVTVELLKNYLTPEFVAYLSNYSAEEIVRTYGTHVLLGIDLGGRLKYDYKGAVVKETTFENKVRNIKAGFSIGINKIFGVNLSADLTKEEKTKISNETTEKLFVGTFYGGTNSGTVFNGDAEGNTSVSINLISWQQSINANNASLIGINRSAPIYDFIADPIKKGLVKAAVEKYISDRQVKDLGEIPVTQFFNPTTGGHVYTANINDYPYQYNGWQNFGIIFYAFKTKVAGTLPVHLFTLDSQHQHIYTIDRYNWPYEQNGFKYAGVSFYAYPNQINGTSPVYSFYNPSTHKNVYTADKNDYAYEQNGWVNQGIAFYAYAK